MHKHLISGFLALSLLCGFEAGFLQAADEPQVIEFTYDRERELPRINLPAADGRAPIAVAQNKTGAEGAGDGQMLDTLFSSGELESKSGPAGEGDSSVIYLEKISAPKKEPAPYAPLPPNVKAQPAEAKAQAPAGQAQPAAAPGDGDIVRKKSTAKKAAVKQTGPRSFCDQYSGAYQKRAFNPRARAVVNPHPSPRPPLAEVYPQVRGRQDADFRLWELAIHNWSRVR
ncbi:hypothetical protein LJB99_04855 [Deltaproteobacteria bacterium OttesenSCG-928-K17]|nr:hypothetical protein [Deltaproteobacteria bacterium OttesenSCG-928-K17]